jgi:FAD/FMN-containing dehydrogenase
VLYGKTRDHVLELKCVLLDGTPWHAKPLDAGDLDLVKARDDRIGAVHRTLDDIVNANAVLIAERYPSLNRCVTGYDLVHVRQDDGRFRLESVICGAEGTLAFVIAAKVRLTPVPRHSALFNIRYGSFDAALRDARILMQLEAASSETLDATVLSLARGDPVWAAVASYFPDDSEGPARGVNVVEFLADDARALESTIARVEALLRPDADSPRRGYTIARDPAAIKAIWSMRKKSVGLLGNMSGERRPVPFVEDTVVPPEVLADYIGEFRAAPRPTLPRIWNVRACGCRVPACPAGARHERSRGRTNDPRDHRRSRRVDRQVQGRPLGRARQGPAFRVRARILWPALSEAAGDQGRRSIPTTS